MLNIYIRFITLSRRDRGHAAFCYLALDVLIVLHAAWPLTVGRFVTSLAGVRLVAVTVGCSHVSWDLPFLRC